MATLKQQIESHLPFTLTAPNEAEALAWMSEIQYVLVHIVDEMDASLYTKSFEVTVTGLDITAMRFITPHKDGFKAGMYPQHVFPLLSDQNYKGIYSASATAPAAVIKDGKIYIFPGGGHVNAFGVPVTNDLSASDITGLPLPFKSACIYYVAIQFLKQKMQTENEGKQTVSAQPVPALNPTFPTLTREAFAEAIALAAHPSAPLDPSLSADQATAPNVTAPNIASPALSTGAGGENYTKENLALVYTKVDNRSLDDDIEMLQGEIQILQKKVEEANTRMNDELNRVNTLLQGYQSKVQHSLEQGRLTASATNSQEQLKLNQQLSNAQNKLTAAIEEKRLLFTKYQAEINSVMGENQNKIAEFQQKVNVWAQRNDLNVAEFQTITNRMIAKYQTDIQALFETHRAEVQKVSTNVGAADSKIQSYLQSINLLTQQFSSAVEAYLRSVATQKYIPAPRGEQQ